MRKGECETSVNDSTIAYIFVLPSVCHLFGSVFALNISNVKKLQLRQLQLSIIAIIA